MGHIEGSQDRDLHDGNGEHVGTARTANGRDLERHERRIRAHLAAHRELDQLVAEAERGYDVNKIRPLVPVQALATELGISVAEVLARADAAIEKLHESGGLEEIRGFSTQRLGGGKVAVTEPLAELLRKEKS